MNREVKFRAWDTKINEMLPVVKLNFQAKEVTYYESEDYEDKSDWQHFENCILMQYTGLKDKNGVDVYDGDILKANHTTVAVEWTGHSWGAANELDNEDYIVITDPGSFEVIGNIHENPELLWKSSTPEQSGD